MPKSKHRRKGKVRNKKILKTPPKPKPKIRKEKDIGLYISEHPFNEVPKSELREAFLKIGKQAESDFEQEKKTIKDFFSQFFPEQVLSVMAMYSLFSLKDENNNLVGSFSATGLQQAHVELSQAIFLSIPIDKFEPKVATPQDFTNIFDRVEFLVDAYTESGFIRLEKANTKEEKYYLHFSEQLRLHTQFVRNWGHFDDVEEILNELYSPLDKTYEESFALKASDIIRIFKFMLEQVENRSSEIMVKLQLIFSQKTKKLKIEKYFELFPDLKGKPDDLFHFIKENQVSTQGLIYVILSHLELRYPEIFRFKFDKLAKTLGLDEENIKSALSYFSYEFGDLSDFPFDYFFLGNPIWDKPLIRVQDEEVFCLMPQLFFGFSFRILDQILKEDEKSKNILEKRRAKFLEERIASLFQTAFKTSHILPDVKWSLDGKVYQTDLLVKIDSHLIIVEAKSGNVPPGALRGGISGAKTRIEELIISPAIQAGRLEEAIRNSREGKDNDFKISLPFDLDKIQRIVKLAVTLEDFATIQANTKELNRLGLIPDNTPLVATLSLSDLKTVLELLETEAERIHYLIRRNEIQESVLYKGDEMDMLAFYFEKGFAFGEFEEGEKFINLFGMSKPIDDYFQSLAHGGDQERPRRKLTKWFRDICDFLSKSRPERWTEMANLVLSLDFEEQRKAEHEFNKICRQLRKIGKPEEGQLNTIVQTPPKWAGFGLALVAFFEEERKSRHNLMQNAANMVFKGSHVKQCVVLAKDLGGKNYPYTTLAVYQP